MRLRLLRLLPIPALGLVISVMAHAANAADGRPVAVMFAIIKVLQGSAHIRLAVSPRRAE